MLGSMIATLGTRITVFGLADLRGSLSAVSMKVHGSRPHSGLASSYRAFRCPYVAWILGGRAAVLGGILVAFFAFLLAHSRGRCMVHRCAVLLPDWERAPSFRDDHLHQAPSAEAAAALRHRDLRDEPGDFTQCGCIVGGLLYRPLVVALDLLAILYRAAADGAVRLARNANGHASSTR